MTIGGIVARIGLTLAVPLILILIFLEVLLRETWKGFHYAWLEVKINVAEYRRFMREVR